MKALLKKWINRVAKRHFLNMWSVATVKARREPAMPSAGFNEHRVNSGAIEFLSDDDLDRLNHLLPWKCFTADMKGRRFGNTAWEGKRDTPQVIPDRRILEMDRIFNLASHSVLEVGCFEGVHTIALAERAASVHAIDSRIENVVKTIVRTHMFGLAPVVSVCDLEQDAHVARLPVADLVHHVGVLYHLKDPVGHLQQLGRIARKGLLLDTHYATDEMTDASYNVAGQDFRYYTYREKGREEVFSGMYDHAKWLLLKDIDAILRASGFSEITIFQDARQRNGPRVTLFADRP